MRVGLYIVALILAFTSCNLAQTQNSIPKMTKQSDLINTKIKNHSFLECMYSDTYFPKFLVDKCKHILVHFCSKIESEKPTNLEELYKLSHSATDQINDLQDEFYENDSEIETAARECFGAEFEFISKAYGFDADIEELIATREW